MHHHLLLLLLLPLLLHYHMLLLLFLLHLLLLRLHLHLMLLLFLLHLHLQMVLLSFLLLVLLLHGRLVRPKMLLHHHLRHGPCLICPISRGVTVLVGIIERHASLLLLLRQGTHVQAGCVGCMLVLLLHHVCVVVQLLPLHLLLVMVPFHFLLMELQLVLLLLLLHLKPGQCSGPLLDHILGKRPCHSTGHIFQLLHHLGGLIGDVLLSFLGFGTKVICHRLARKHHPSVCFQFASVLNGFYLGLCIVHHFLHLMRY
jgi:hypothetical protein